MKYRSMMPCLMVLCVVGSGCSTMQADRRNADMRREAEVQHISNDLKRLQSRMDGLVSTQEDLYRQIEGLRGTLSGRDGDLDRQLRTLTDNVASTASAREVLKREIIDSVSRNVQDMLKRRAPPPVPVQRGVEHTVESGQTLSAIASAYGVTTAALIKANGLKNPDRLRPGDTLFIPE